MITPLDIRTSVFELLEQRYPEYKRYGNVVLGDFERPAFFVNIKPITSSIESLNYKLYSYSIILTYYQNIADDLDNLTKVHEIESLFGYQIKVKDRFLNISDLSYDFIGESKNILQITVNFKFYEDMDHEDNVQAAKSLNINMEKR